MEKKSKILKEKLKNAEKFYEQNMLKAAKWSRRITALQQQLEKV